MNCTLVTGVRGREKHRQEVRLPAEAIAQPGLGYYCVTFQFQEREHLSTPLFRIFRDKIYNGIYASYEKKSHSRADTLPTMMQQTKCKV